MRKQAASPLLAGSAPQKDWLGWGSGSRGSPCPTADSRGVRDPKPALGRRAYRSSHAASLFAAGRSAPSPAAGDGGGEQGVSAEARGAAMELRGLRAERTDGAGRTGRRELWFGAPRRMPAGAPRGLQVP